MGYTCHQLGIPTYPMWAIPVTNWVHLPIRCGLYMSPTGYTYLSDVGYTCHQQGIPIRCGLYLSPTDYTYQMWAVPVINWVNLPIRCGLYLVPVTNLLYLPNRCGLYLSGTDYTYLSDVGYTCRELTVPTYPI